MIVETTTELLGVNLFSYRSTTFNTLLRPESVGGREVTTVNSG